MLNQLESLSELICDKLELDKDSKCIKPQGKSIISYKELIFYILKYGSTLEISKQLNYSKHTIEYAVRKLPINKDAHASYRLRLLELINFKYCNTCISIKENIEFPNSSYTITGKASNCKECTHNHYKQYYNDNKFIFIANTIRRRSLTNSYISKELVKEVFVRDNFECKKCFISELDHEIQFGTSLHIDHIIPVSKQGTNDINNLQLLCRSCNLSKYNK